MLTIFFQSFISIGTLKHFKFVNEVRARTHEKLRYKIPMYNIQIYVCNIPWWSIHFVDAYLK